MAASQIAVGSLVMVHTRIKYRQYELPASSVGTVVTVDNLGDCRVDWTAMGTKWLLHQSFRNISVHDAEGNWAAFDPPPTGGEDDDEFGSVEDERASPFSARSRALQCLPDPVRNLAGSFDGTCTALPEPPAEPTIINLVVPEEVPQDGDYPLGLILDNTTGDICVTEVEPDSWGARSGVVPGDVLLELNGQPVKSAAQGEVERLGKLRPLPIKVLRPALRSASPGSGDPASDLLAQVRACELRADATENSLAAARRTPLSKQDLADMLGSHRARAEDAERRAIQLELRADFLVARSEGRPVPRNSNDPQVLENTDTAIETKSVLIGFSELQRAPPSGVRDSAEEFALSVPELVTERIPEPCCRCSTPALGP